MDLFDHHPLVNGLAHVIYGQKRRRHAGQRLHLHPCLSFRLNLAEGLDLKFFRVHLESDFRVGKIQQMAHRNQFRRPLRSHDPCHLGYRQHIALLHLPAGDGFKHFPAYPDLSLCQGSPLRDFFAGDIDHYRIAILIKMTEFHLFSSCLLS